MLTMSSEMNDYVLVTVRGASRRLSVDSLAFQTPKTTNRANIPKPVTKASGIDGTKNAPVVLLDDEEPGPLLKC